MSEIWNYDIYLNCEDFILRRSAVSENIARREAGKIVQFGLTEESEEGIARYPPHAISKIRIHYPVSGHKRESDPQGA